MYGREGWRPPPGFGYNPRVRAGVTRKIRKLPERPGVYLFRDAKGRVLYIGKAKCLRERVTHYLRAADLEPRIRTMTEKATDLDHIEAPSEIDALLMEARLIKDLHPKYNSDLKDDKSFSVLELTENDDFPKVRVVHETDEVLGRRYGPFLSAGELREAVRILQRIFRFATCSLDIREGDDRRRFFRPCLLHAIHRCTAPCAARISKEGYGADITSFERFLQGERGPLLEDLRKRMKEASKGLDFERAAELRDQIRALEGLSRRSHSYDYLVGDITPIDPREGIQDLLRLLRYDGPLRTIEGTDIAQLGGKEAVGSLVQFVDGVPFKPGYRRYRIKTVQGIDDYAMIREVLHRRFRPEDGERAAPDLLLIDGGIGHLAAAAAELRSRKAGPLLLLSLAKREETLYRWTDRPMEVPVEKSAASLRLLMYVRDEAHRFAQHYHHLLRRKAIREEA